MRRLYVAHNHDSDYRLKHGDWPPDDFVMFREVGKPLENGEILTLERFVEWEDKYVALVQDFFATLGKETFYLSPLPMASLDNVSLNFRERLAEIGITKRANKDDLEPLVRAKMRGQLWCQIATGPVTYFAMSDDLYTRFSFDDDELNFEQLDHHGLSIEDITERFEDDPESYEPIDIPPGFFDND